MQQSCLSLPFPAISRTKKQPDLKRSGCFLWNKAGSGQIDGADLLRIDLRLAAFGQQAGRLLLHVRDLRVAIAVR
jgi:hypothetical protein